jgi:hypothetical protein
VRVNDTERKTRGDVWLTSYWSQLDAALDKKTIALLDADTGKDLEAKVQFVGPEKFGPENKQVTLQHIKLSGNVEVDLWYDEDKRLVRQEWVEQGHKTLMELKGIRR